MPSALELRCSLIVSYRAKGMTQAEVGHMFANGEGLLYAEHQVFCTKRHFEAVLRCILLLRRLGLLPGVQPWHTCPGATAPIPHAFDSDNPIQGGVAQQV